MYIWVLDPYTLETIVQLLLLWGNMTRCRSLRDLHTEGRMARGCVNHKETEPSDVTDLYQGLRGSDNASTA